MSKEKELEKIIKYSSQVGVDVMDSVNQYLRERQRKRRKAYENTLNYIYMQMEAKR